MLFNDKNVSRLISKRFCEWVDSDTVSLMVRSIAVLKCFSRSVDICTSIKRRASKCLNLRSLIMLHEESFMYLTCFDFMKDLLAVSPGLVKLQSNASNWLVETSIGTRLFNSYVPDSSLTVDNILEILVLSLMAEDVNTLSTFYPLTLNDLEVDGSLISVKSQLRVSEDYVRCCLHYTDRSNRPITLKRDKDSNIWHVEHIGLKVSLNCVICTVSLSGP